MYNTAHTTMKKRTTIILFGIIILLNLAAWFVVVPKSTTPSTAALRATYPYISPRVLYDNPNDIILNFVSLRKNLEAKFAALPQGTQYSFYFEYLPSGTSIRIGSDNELVAASLIKVPLVMNLFKAAELKKLSLDDVITITESELDNGYGDLWKKGAGTKLSFRALAQLALEQSDNTATHAIYDHTKDVLNEDQQSLAQLDIDQDLENSQAVINAKAYTSVLKSLYLATYVNRDSSNEILGYLTNSAEHSRLTKDLPKNVKVAHKNGVYNQQWSESDCGIIYATKRPYALCIMIGLPDQQANEFMASMSREIYDYVTTE